MSVDNDGSHRLSAMEFKIARLAMHARLATPPHAEKKNLTTASMTPKIMTNQ